jgi:hypothetical protein
MRDRRWTGPGLGILGAALVFGAWYGIAAGGGAPRAMPELPRDGSRCVEPAAWMIPNHPGLLLQWREEVVRLGRREYRSSTGEVHVMSLTGTCLRCHGARTAFCNRCHEYAGVMEKCWECHVGP